MKIYWLLPLLLVGGCLSAPREQTVAPPPAPPPQTVGPVELPEIFALPERKIPAHSTYSVLTKPAPGRPGAGKARLLAGKPGSSSHAGLTLLPKEIQFDFPMVDNERVRYYIDYYTGPGRKVFSRLLQRAERYIPYMRGIFREEGLPEDLTYLAMVESGFNPNAYSRSHASGPWQFIESTGNLYGLSNDWWRDERRDFEKSTRAAARFLGDLHSRFEGDWYLAVAAYNAGGGTISRAVEASETTDFWELSESSSLREETRNYLPKLLAMMTIAKNPEAYGFGDIGDLDPFAYDVVSVSGVVDLELVARLCEVSHDDIRSLNPELKRWCTPPDIKRYELRLPVGKRSLFEKRYAEMPADSRIDCRRHRIARGDTLGSIARKYRIRQADLIAMNKMTDPRRLRIGDELLLPMRQGQGCVSWERTVATNEPRRGSYQVRGGDTLWSIARRYGVDAKQLARWNNLAAGEVLHPGQNLTIRSAESANAGATVARSAGFDAQGTRKIVYRVKSGDTLTAIGRRYSIPAARIKTWNKLADNHVLRPGDQLTLLVLDNRPG